MAYTQAQQDFFEEIRTDLSGNLVDVELSDDDVFHAFKMARRSWNQYGNNNEDRRFYELDVTKGVKEYTLSQGVDPVVINHVVRPQAGGFASDDPFTQSAWQNVFDFQYSSSGNIFMIYDLTAQLLEQAKQYSVYESEFIYTRGTKKITFLKAPPADQKWLLDAYFPTSDDDLMANNLWVFRYTAAEAKRILGRAYRKFGSLPSPVGTDQIDGNDLVSEAEQEKQKLEEDIMEFVYGEPDGMSILIG